jgi:hypothetical protein
MANARELSIKRRHREQAKDAVRLDQKVCSGNKACTCLVMGNRRYRRARRSLNHLCYSGGTR